MKRSIQRIVATVLVAGTVSLAAPAAFASEASGSAWDPWCRDPAAGWSLNGNPPSVTVWADPGELCPIH